MDKPMKIVVRAFWDSEAKVWAAAADDDLGIFTEAATLEALWAKLPELAKDFLERDDVEVDLLVTNLHMIAAE